MSKNVVDMIAKRRSVTAFASDAAAVVERGTKCHICDKVYSFLYSILHLLILNYDYYRRFINQKKYWHYIKFGITLVLLVEQETKTGQAANAL